MITLKKGLLASSIAASLLGVGVASAVEVPPEYLIKYNNYEQFLNDQADADGNFQLVDPANFGNGTEDLRGVVSITQILDNDPLSPTFELPTWSNDGSDGYLYGVFYGLDVIDQTVTGVDIDLRYGGGSLDIYWTPNPINFLTAGVSAFGATSNIYDPLNGATANAANYLFLSTDLAGGCDTTNLAATICSTTNLTPPNVNGTGDFYLAVGTTANGTGVRNDNFDTNGAFLGNDAYATNTFNTPIDANGDGRDDNSNIPCATGTSGPTCIQWLGDWNLRSFDPVIGNYVPEPASIALLGLGLAGLGYRRRQRSAK